MGRPAVHAGTGRADFHDYGGDEFIEPDGSLLTQQEEDFEEPLDLREHLSNESGEDPVRLYLSEIGQVKLLGADNEFRLATTIEGERMIEALKKNQTAQGNRTGGFDLSFNRYGTAYIVGSLARGYQTP